jgi:antitoxin component YwqK of YwqJK toxin-antitoxin module
MKFYYFLFLSLVISLYTSAQVSKIYITSVNKYSDDPANAVSYILVSRAPDSLYLVKQFDMQDSITMEGAYKDNQLSIQQGEFKFYRVKKPARMIRLDYIAKKTDTSFIPGKNYVYQKGSYIDGKKTGEWLDYDINGKKIKLITFRDGLANGPFRLFGKDGQIGMQGQYINGKHEGVWYTRTFKGDTSVVDYYSNGVLEKNVQHWSEKKFQSKLKQAQAPYNPIAIIYNGLYKSETEYLLSCKDYHSAFSFVLTSDGHLTVPVIDEVNNLKLDSHILEILLSSRKWKAAELDGKKVDSKITISVNLVYSKGTDVELIAFMSPSYVKGYDGY